MTAVAILRRPLELPVLVARRTIRRTMRTSKSKIRLVVIEYRRLPGIDRMTGKTIAGELTCGMIRCLCRSVILLMTGETIRIQSLIPVVRMAGRAFNGCMSADELEIRLRMFKDGGTPAVDGVA